MIYLIFSHDVVFPICSPYLCFDRQPTLVPISIYLITDRPTHSPSLTTDSIVVTFVVLLVRLLHNHRTNLVQ